MPYAGRPPGRGTGGLDGKGCDPRVHGTDGLNGKGCGAFRETVFARTGKRGGPRPSLRCAPHHIAARLRQELWGAGPWERDEPRVASPPHALGIRAIRGQDSGDGADRRDQRFDRG